MGLAIRWRTNQGQRTDDNRDCCGVGLRNDMALCVVLDGSSSGDDSGVFARRIARDLIDWFMTAGDASADSIINRLRELHAEMSPSFRKASASYIIALVKDQGAVCVLHAGDCLAGFYDGTSSLDWRTQPHTLANWSNTVEIEHIARSPLRNRISHNFRSREFMTPDVSALTLEAQEMLVLATDGFWAELDQERQTQFLIGIEKAHPAGHDDCSVLSLTIGEDLRNEVIGDAEADGLYVVRATGS